MRSRASVIGVSGLVAGVALVAARVILAQGAPVAAMFHDDQKRDASLALSFASVELAATRAGVPLHVYLTAGDLERAFDRLEFRPDATIIPTNTDLLVTASDPATQRVLIARVQKQPEAMRELESQVATRRKQSSAPTDGEPGLLRIGIDSFVAQLAPGNGPSQAAFPKTACFVATDFATGGAIDRRELFLQDRMRQGIAGCLDALDAAGAQSLVLPQLGAASSTTQTNDAMYEGQRTLKECRLLNSTAGIALGIHDFAVRRRNLREIGVVQWDKEIVGMFKVPPGSRAERNAQAAYRAYAKQVREVLQKGLAGEKVTANDLQGNCGPILSGT
jgi:hypothetical protein